MEKLILKKNSQTWDGVKELFLETIPDFVPAGTLTISRGLNNFQAKNCFDEKIGIVSDTDFRTLWETESLTPKNEFRIPAVSEQWEPEWSEE